MLFDESAYDYSVRSGCRYRVDLIFTRKMRTRLLPGIFTTSSVISFCWHLFRSQPASSKS
jgi:hypothetical protein